MYICSSNHGKSSKTSNNFLLVISNTILVIRVRTHKMLVRIAYSEGPDQIGFFLDLRCLSIPFWQTNGVRNFRTSTLLFITETAPCEI